MTQDEIDLYESKARWCDEHGFPEDAAQHRAYVKQLRKGGRMSTDRTALEQALAALENDAEWMDAEPERKTARAALALANEVKP
jgi:hypothetical protein